MFRNLAGFAVVIIYLVFATLPLTAQIDRASLNGTVTDASGSIVQNAQVDVTAADTGFRRQTITGDTGTYQVPGLPIGVYKVAVTKEGFRPINIEQVTLSVGETRTVDARLEVGEQTEIVEVVSVVEAVNRSSAEVGTVNRRRRDSGDSAQRTVLRNSDDACPRRNQCRREEPNATFDSTGDHGTTTTSLSTASTPAAFRNSPRKRKPACRFRWSPSPSFA